MSETNTDLNFQIGGKTIVGERLENFSKKYGFFTKTFNIVKKELSDLGNSRKVAMIHKSSFAAYINIKTLSHKFGFRNLDSNKSNVIEEIKPLIQQLQSDGAGAKFILVMPFFIRSRKGLETDILFINISHKKDNKFLIDIDRVSAFSQTEKSDADAKLAEIGEEINNNFHVELHDDSFEVDVNIKEYKFDNDDTMDFDIDIIDQNLIYSLYFLYKRLQRCTVDLQTVFDETMSYSNNTDFVDFLKKSKLLEDLGIQEKSFVEKLNQGIVHQLKKRPDKDSTELMNKLDKTFDEMKQMYLEFDTETINIKELTEGIEAKTAELVELFEAKNEDYKKLNKTRIIINDDIEKIYAELVQLKDAIVFGMDNLIEHRGIINRQLKKFEKLEKNHKYYEDHKEVFEKIKEDLNKMIATQEEFDHKISNFKDRLAEKKDELKEKNDEISKVDINIKDTEQALNIIRTKLKSFKQEGGNKKTINLIVTKASNRQIMNKLKKSQNIYEQNIKLNKEIEDILSEDTLQIGGRIGRPPSKSKLDKAIINLNKHTIELKRPPMKNKKKTKAIIQEFIPVLNKYQNYIETYHKQMNDRQILKDTLRESYNELRKLETGFKNAKNTFKSQDQDISRIVLKIDSAIDEMENNPKGLLITNKLKKHKEKLTSFLNSRGKYNDKVQKINSSLRKKKKSLDGTKNEVRVKLTELKQTGKQLDEIKKELEEKTAMYGGSVLRKSIILNKFKQDIYLKYLMNPIEYVIKGGKNINNILMTQKNKNNWIDEEPEYIFGNFNITQLRKIAKKWNLREYKNKGKIELSNTLKFVLYGKAGFVKSNNDYLLLAALLNVDLININNKKDSAEIKKQVNIKLKAITLPISIQGGGAPIKLTDSIRIKEKYVPASIRQEIVVQIKQTKTEFIKNLRTNSTWKNFSYDFEKNAEKLGPVTLIRNKKPEKSFTTAKMSLEDFTPEFFDFVENHMGESWVKGDYLNRFQYKAQTVYPQQDYISFKIKDSTNGIDMKSFINIAHSSLNAGVLIKGNELVALVNRSDMVASGFKNILEKTAKQLANSQSSHLNSFTQTAQNELPKKRLVAWQPQVIPSSNVVFHKKIIEKIYKIIQPNDEITLSLSKTDFRIIVRTTNNSKKYEIRSPDKLTANLIGYKLTSHHISWIIQSKDVYSKQTGHKLTNKQYYFDLDEIKIVSFMINIFTESKILQKIINENRANQRGGSAIEIISKRGEKYPNLLKNYGFKPEPIKNIDGRFFTQFADRGDDIMDQFELSETIKFIGDQLIILGKDKSLQKPLKNKIAVLNIIKDDENNVIDRSSLMKYLDDVDDFVNGFKMNEQTRQITGIVQNIRDYYKGSEWSGVIKSKKQILYQHLEKLSKFGRHIPPLQKEIAKFIKSFELLTEKYKKDYLDLIKSKKTKEYSNLSHPPLKSQQLEKFVNQIENLVYKKENIKSGKITGADRFNFDQFPVDKMGKAQLKMFIQNLRRIITQALKDETDIALLDRMIMKLEILHMLIGEWVYEGLNLLPKEFDLNDFANLAEAKKIIDSFSDSFRNEKEKAVDTGSPLNQYPASSLYPKDKYFAHIHPVGELDDTRWTRFGSDSNIKIKKIDENVPNNKRTVADGKRWLNKIEQMKEKLIDFRLILISRLYDDVPIENLDLDKLGLQNIKQFLDKYILTDLRKDYEHINRRILKNERFENIPMKKRDIPDEDEDGERVRIGRDKANTLMGDEKLRYEAHWKKETEFQGEEKDASEFEALTDYDLDIRFLKKTLGEFISSGGSIINAINRTDAISAISESLEEKINNIKGGDKKNDIKQQAIDKLIKLKNSSYEEIGTVLRDKNNFNQFKTDLPVSIIENRQKQLEILSNLKTDVSKLLAGGGALSDEIADIKDLNILVKNSNFNSEVTRISENIYEIIQKNNPKFKLPAYNLVEDLELVNFIGYAHKFKDEKWDEDHDFHGSYKDYINTIVSGVLFDKGVQQQLTKIDTGNLNNISWLQLFYTSLMNYMTFNKLTTFSIFLKHTYEKIFAENVGGISAYPKFQYNEFWDRIMFEIGNEWDQKIKDRGYTGLKEFLDLTVQSGGEEKQFNFSLMEKALLFSLIIHSKQLIQDDDGIPTINPTQKYNIFKEYIPKDTSYLMIALPNELQQTPQTPQTPQTGGADVADAKPFLESQNDYVPGSFLINKNLDTIRELYIYDKVCKQKVLRDRPDLARPLHTPLIHNFDDFTKKGIGLAREGLSQVARIPRIHKDSKELRQCTEYRLKNTGKKENPDWTRWDFEKESNSRGEFIPLILWPINELNRIEKGILCIDEYGDEIEDQKNAQEVKYKSLDILVESSHTDYPDFKDSEHIDINL